MRASSTILLFVLLSAHALCAAEKFTNDCMAPDFKHQVVLRGDDESGGYELAIRAPNEDKPLFSRPAGGYAAFSMATDPVNFKCLWSPDSKLVAIFERGTKRSGDTTIYFVRGAKVQEIPLPDIMPLIRPHLTAEMRAIWVRPENWLPDHGLVLSVIGTQMDEDHGNFQFILTLQLSLTKTGKWTAKKAAFRQGRLNQMRPNHALQRTAPGVTACAPTRKTAPAAFPHRLRCPPQSLSLGSLAAATRHE